MKKIAVITTSRADYGLLKPVIGLLDDPIIVCSGTHLSPEHGMTKNEIDHIDFEVEILLSSDTEKGVCSAAGLTLIKFGELFDRIKPDLVLVLGDRFEVLSACVAAKIHRIPIAHIHGGEVSGGYDDSFRNCITHMATYHFPATYQARENIAYMLDIKSNYLHRYKNIKMVGALGCDGLVKRTEKPQNRFVVVVHPETLTRNNWANELKSVFKNRKEVVDWIMPNADNGRYSLVCAEMISKTFEREKYLDSLRNCRAIIGNSSSSVIEAPALGVPSILIGNRQKGRELAESIICCEPNQESIKQALTKLESKDFQDLMKTDYYMPYKGESVAGKIVEVLNKL